MILRDDSLESINQELAALLVCEQDHVLPPAIVPEYIQSNVDACLDRFLVAYPTVDEIAASALARASTHPEFVGWFIEAYVSVRARLKNLTDEDRICGLALWLRQAFMAATSKSKCADQCLVCSLALSLKRDELIHPALRMDAIAETVRRTIGGGEVSDYFTKSLPFIPPTYDGILLLSHLDAFGHAHSLRPFRYACSLFPKFLQQQFPGLPSVNKIRTSRLLQEFAKLDLIQYIDRGCNDREQTARRPAIIGLVQNVSDWPTSPQAIQMLQLLLETMTPESKSHEPRKTYTREDSFCLNVNDIKDRARGHWPDILQSVGLTVEQVGKRKKSECPFCCALGQWRLGDRRGDGSGVCDKCAKTGLGDGFKVLEKLTGWNFWTCLAYVAGRLDGRPADQLRSFEKKRLTQRIESKIREKTTEKSAEEEYEKIVREWCQRKSVRRNDLIQFQPISATRRVQLDDGSFSTVTVIRVPLFVADSHGKPLRSGYCDFGTATERLAKGMHGRGHDGVFLRNGIGFQTGQVVLAIEGLKDACALIRLGKYNVIGLPGLRLPPAAQALLRGTRGVLIPDSKAIGQYRCESAQSEIERCIAAIRKGAKVVDVPTDSKGRPMYPKWVVGNLNYERFGKQVDDLRDLLNAGCSEREVIPEIDQMEVAARCGRNAAGTFIKVEGSVLIKMKRGHK